jgi:hypothetical protein
MELDNQLSLLADSVEVARRKVEDLASGPVPSVASVLAGETSRRLGDAREELHTIILQLRKDKATPRPLENLGTRLGVMLQAKNEAYGSAFLKCDEFLSILWPDGVPRSAYGTMLILVRMFDKMMRIATAPDAFNEDAESDLAGYAMLLVYTSIVKAKRTTP